jgi:hypothetical protein
VCVCVCVCVCKACTRVWMSRGARQAERVHGCSRCASRAAQPTQHTHTLTSKSMHTGRQTHTRTHTHTHAHTHSNTLCVYVAHRHEYTRTHTATHTDTHAQHRHAPAALHGGRHRVDGVLLPHDAPVQLVSKAQQPFALAADQLADGNARPLARVCVCVCARACVCACVGGGSPVVERAALCITGSSLGALPTTTPAAITHMRPDS